MRHPPPGTQRKPDDLGPELALDNVWAINYGTGEGRRAATTCSTREDIAIDEVRA